MMKNSEHVKQIYYCDIYFTSGRVIKDHPIMYESKTELAKAFSASECATCTLHEDACVRVFNTSTIENVDIKDSPGVPKRGDL